MYCLLFLQEVCTLILAAALMGDRMSMLNWLGFAVCLCGISLHVGLKTYYSKSKCFYTVIDHNTLVLSNGNDITRLKSVKLYTKE